MKKILAMVFVLCMLTSSVLAEEALNLDDMSEKVTISVQSNSMNRPARDLKDDFIRQQLQKDLNIDLQLVCKPYEEYFNALNMQISGGDIPDVFYVNKVQFEKFAPSGLFLDMKPYLNQMPNYQKAFPGISEDEAMLTDGHLYKIGGKFQRGIENTVPSYFSMWIRQDWLTKLNLKAPTTLDEFYEVCRAFKEDDPDGNGKQDTIPFSGWYAPAGDLSVGLNMFPFVFGAYGTSDPCGFVKTEKGIQPSIELEGSKAAIEYIKKLIDAGFVDPDIMAYKDCNQFNEFVYKNKVGIIVHRWSDFVKPPFGDQLRELCPDAEWVQMTTVAGPDGTRSFEPYVVPGTMDSCFVIAARVAEDPVKLARVLKYIDYISEGDGLRLVCYGIEGRNYTVDADGNVKINFELSKETENASQHQICDRNEKDYLLTKFANIRSAVEFAAAEPRIDDYIGYLPTVDGVNNADRNRYISENLVKFAYGDRSLDEFDEFITKLYNVYGQEKLNEAINSSVKEAGL